MNLNVYMKKCCMHLCISSKQHAYKKDIHFNGN